ncbi:MAG TPA: hypothetical protein VLB44_18790 [Kofleriaceae bacterium]|nr:hypothetical protein [Kofleriaceae bacterium]
MLRFARVLPVLIVGIATAAKAQPAPEDQPAPAPLPTPTPINEPEPQPAPPPEEPAIQPDPQTDTDVTPLAQDEPTHKKVKKQITYEEGRWLVFHGPDHFRLRFRLILQPMARFGHVDVIPDWTTDMIIRRGRIGWETQMQKDLGMRFEIDVKNMHFEIHNMYGWWKPHKHMEVQFGFIKAPGGLERDTFSFDQPFIERSVVTFLNYDHEMGLKLEGSTDDKRWRYAASVTRDPPQLPGGDPEDTPAMPMGVEKEDITRPISKWNAAARFIAAPSDEFEASIRTGLRFRPDEADFGEIAVEPYDTTFLTNRPWHGTWVSVSADSAVVQPHWKAVVEGGFRRDGAQLEYPNGLAASEREVNGGHLHSWNGYAVFGYTPNGHYGPAVRAAPLLDGWELVMRLNGARVNPVDAGVATMYSVEGGVHWEVSPHLRLQADFAYEVFGKNDHTYLDENLDAHRIWIQTWATLRI